MERQIGSLTHFFWKGKSWLQCPVNAGQGKEHLNDITKRVDQRVKHQHVVLDYAGSPLKA